MLHPMASLHYCFEAAETLLGKGEVGLAEEAKVQIEAWEARLEARPKTFAQYSTVVSVWYGEGRLQQCCHRIHHCPGMGLKCHERKWIVLGYCIRLRLNCAELPLVDLSQIFRTTEGELDCVALAAERMAFLPYVVPQLQILQLQRSFRILRQILTEKFDPNFR